VQARFLAEDESHAPHGMNPLARGVQVELSSQSRDVDVDPRMNQLFCRGAVLNSRFG
jgi:hypothetical protein